MNGQRSVLIVDRSQETREVLQTVLERRGVRTLAAGRAEMGLALAREHRPDLVVLDLETEGVPAGQFSDQPRLILLGSMCRRAARPRSGQFVAKPYHYGPLIRKIEELLYDRRPEAQPSERDKGVSQLSAQRGNQPRECVPCRRCSSSAESIRAAGSS
jgi:DNA-binding NtrC family response regulator